MHAEELGALVTVYERRRCAHMGIFTELAILLSRYKPTSPTLALARRLEKHELLEIFQLAGYGKPYSSVWSDDNTDSSRKKKHELWEEHISRSKQAKMYKDASVKAAAASAANTVPLQPESHRGAFLAT
ncbi:hypothetical protein FB446DRAFT_824906 [Lentinula raphanica]|nr:hypothetical protein FB446DRAFT_824906 [Lentinula raphanica]